jgi:hypothetical protein
LDEVLWGLKGIPFRGFCLRRRLKNDEYETRHRREYSSGMKNEKALGAFGYF